MNGIIYKINKCQLTLLCFNLSFFITKVPYVMYDRMFGLNCCYDRGFNKFISKLSWYSFPGQPAVKLFTSNFCNRNCTIN